MSHERRKEIGRERRERTRRRLLAAAARLIATVDLDRLNIDDFIKEAEVSRGTFYNFYATKDELIDELWDAFGHDPFQEINQLCAKTANPVEKIAMMFMAVALYAKNNSTWGWLVYSISGDRKMNNADLLSFPHPDLNLARKQGWLDFESLALATDLTVSITRMALLRALTDEKPLSDTKELCVMLLRSLGVTKIDVKRLVESLFTVLNDSMQGLSTDGDSRFKVKK